MARTKSLRPRIPLSAAAQRAARLLATLGRPGPDELDALLEGIVETDTLSLATAMSPLELADAALSLFAAAHEILQAASRDQKAKLRGCSTRLVALAIDQALRLHAITSELDHKMRVRDDARRDLAARLPAMETEALHARALLTKVTPETVAARFAALPSPCDLADSLDAMADIARDLLQGATPSVTMRARLYGLDQDFAEGLRQLAAGLRARAKLAAEIFVQDDHVIEAQRAQLATTLLANHFLETFALARGLDKTIPQVSWPRKTPAGPSSEARAAPRSEGRAIVRGPPPLPPMTSPLRIPYVNSR